tara:strand:+ start:393 stop:893 length:501 start_codon:yes stop_codon:yes gene_type:complete
MSIQKKLYESRIQGLDERRLRQDVYAIVDKDGKVVSSKLTKKNAHKEIAKYRYASDATIVLDPDAKDGDILKAFAKKKNKKSDPELDLRRQRSGAYVSKRESVELDEAESLHWNTMKKDERTSILKDTGLPSSFAKDDWKNLDHRAKERMGKYISKSTKGEYALRP